MLVLNCILLELYIIANCTGVMKFDKDLNNCEEKSIRHSMIADKFYYSISSLLYIVVNIIGLYINFEIFMLNLTLSAIYYLLNRKSTDKFKHDSKIIDSMLSIALLTYFLYENICRI